MNTDDLRLLWDCVTRFHSRFFESEPQPRATQIRLLWEEVGEFYAALENKTEDTAYQVLEEAIDVLFVAIGMHYNVVTWEQIARNFKTTVVGFGFIDYVSLIGSGTASPRYAISGLIAVIEVMCMTMIHDVSLHSAIETVITKNDAKTPEAGYRVNAGGKVTNK